MTDSFGDSGILLMINLALTVSYWGKVSYMGMHRDGLVK